MLWALHIGKGHAEKIPGQIGLFHINLFRINAEIIMDVESWKEVSSSAHGEMAPGGAIPIRELKARGHRDDQHILIRAHMAVILDHGIGRAEVLVLARRRREHRLFRLVGEDTHDDPDGFAVRRVFMGFVEQAAPAFDELAHPVAE